MGRSKTTRRSESRTPARTRNTQKISNEELRAPTAPAAPVVAGKVLTSDVSSFLEFLADGACEDLCTILFGGADTSAGIMLQEFRKATGTAHYYHAHRGKLTRGDSDTKKLLKKFARRAYQGDPDRRGVVFWERVAWLLWNAYAAVMALRARAEKIKRQENQRIARLADKQTKRAAYMRRYRAKRSAQRRARQSVRFKESAKQQWRKQRGRQKAQAD